ncbi:EPIDERMAL PATTERNING FACTOR-like protein 6 [Durio zibethinus]|uniref:Epidermal patterning factor-like protein n=1 Tax=Durio zibethinus TaxID=66656 RepID=A0A6P5XS27_DURZI|nr:EPIDERMAL PATTERNING FACTOR-like protein 6 [Durio zibethinus]
MERKRYRKLNLSHKSHFLYCFSLFFFSVCALLSIISTVTTCQQDIRYRYSGQVADGICFQENTERSKNEKRMGSSIPVDIQGLPSSLARRFLSGPGSSPPRCTSKCGNCTPCKPVHVPVPPGTPVTAEYYPEAWRCKCGNKLYMP